MRSLEFKNEFMSDFAYVEHMYVEPVLYVGQIEVTSSFMLKQLHKCRTEKKNSKG